MVALVLTMLTAPPSLLEVADAGAMAWVHVPRAGHSLAKLERNGFADLARLLGPDDVRRALAKARGTELVVAAYRRETTLDVALWLDAGAAAPASVAWMNRWLEDLGPGERSEEGGVALHTRENAGETITVFQSAGRCGWSTDSERARRAMTRAEKPLADDQDLRRLRTRAGETDLQGRIDVQRLYGMVARSPGGRRIAGQVRRLGLDGLRAVDFHVRLTGKRKIESAIHLTVPEPWRDLPAAFGPAILPVRPPEVPPGRAWVRLSVKPADLMYVAEKAYSYERAMEAGLVRAQLDAVERQLKKSFTEDALGHAPEVWTVWSEPQGLVLLAGVADGAIAASVLGAYAEVLPALFPDLTVTQVKAAGQPLLVLTQGGRPILALGFIDKAIVVASTRAQVLRAIKASAGRGRSLGSTQVVAHGESRGLPGSVAVKLLPASLSERFKTYLAEWQARAVKDGFVIDASVRGRK